MVWLTPSDELLRRELAQRRVIEPAAGKAAGPETLNRTRWRPGPRALGRLLRIDKEHTSEPTK